MNVQNRRRRNQTTREIGTVQTDDRKPGITHSKTLGQSQRPPQAANTGRPQQHPFQRPYSTDGGPGFATVSLNLNGDSVPDPEGPCPHGHLDQAISLALHRQNPVRCPICRATPFFVTHTAEYPLSVLELRKSPTDTVHIHQPVALNGPEGGRGWNEPPNENG